MRTCRAPRGIFIDNMDRHTHTRTQNVDTRSYSVQSLTHADVHVNTTQCWGRQDRW